MSRRTTGRSALAAMLGIGVVAAATTFVGFPSASAAAPVVATMELECQTATFAPYPWAAELSATAVTDGTDTVLTIAANDLPGVSPVPLTDAPTAGTVLAVVNGAPVTLTGPGTATAAAKAPVPLPEVSATIAGADSPLTVEIKKLQYDLTAFGTTMATKCPTGAAEMSWVIGEVEVEESDVLPTASPSPTSSPSPSPTATATPTAEPSDEATEQEESKEGTPAKGTAKFSCVLETLGSPFDYNPRVTMAGSRATAEDSEVALRVDFSQIPGLAPVPIENNPMTITAEAKVGGKTVSFTGNSTVSAPIKGEVAVPTMTSTVSTDDEELDVEITAFKFDFGTLSGLRVYSDCNGGGKLSKMTVGIGDDGGDDDAGNDAGDGTGTTTTTSSLPKTGGGAPLVMFGLWAGVFVLFGAALFLFVPRRARRT